MKQLLSLVLLVATVAQAKVDTSSLFINTEALRAYCEKQCLDEGDCVERCMNLDQEFHQSS